MTAAFAFGDPFSRLCPEQSILTRVRPSSSFKARSHQTVVLASAMFCATQHITPFSYLALVMRLPILVLLSILGLLEIDLTSFE